MRENGPNLGMPHTKSMGDGLFEMRLRSVEGLARIFYCSVISNRIYLLHSIIKKTQKTPKRDLDIAKRRMKEVT
jgi:phage-related protein